MKRNRSRRDKVATSNKTLYKVSYEMPFFKKKKKVSYENETIL